MRPRVVTVLTSRRWEESFVADARRTGLVRVVGRAYRADEVAALEPDIAVVGEETAWLTGDVIGLWTALGIKTIVIGNGKSSTDAGAVTHASAASADILATIRSAWLAERATSDLLSVVGPRGSGATEITCVLAAAMAPILVIDRDEPSVSLRLNVPPVGDGHITITDAFPIEPPERLLVDCGNRGPLPEGRCVLVVAHTPAGFVRAAKLIVDWTGPVPDLVINMTRDEQHAVEFALTTLGLEPRLLLPYDSEVAEQAARGEAPPAWFAAQAGVLLSPADAPPLR